MLKNFNSAACVAAMAMLSVASVSCQKDRTTSNGNFSINADMELQDVWSIVYPGTKADGEEPKPVYQYFVFDSGNLLVDHLGSYMNENQISKSFQRNIDFITEAGTYDWQLIYPSCNAVAGSESVPTTMPITVEAKDLSNHTYTFNTSTTTRCTPGTRTQLSAVWSSFEYSDASTININSWQGKQQTGSFDLN